MPPLFLLLAVALLLPTPAAAEPAAPPISFSVSRDGEFIDTEARVDLPVARSLAWAVLTDYERYPEFISSMRESRIVARGPDGVVVEQKGGFSVLFFRQPVEARLLVSEFPQSIIESRAIAGDFRYMTGRYELIGVGNGVRLSFSGRLQPNFSLPAVFGLSIVRYALFLNFRELVAEMLRRGAAAEAAPPGELWPPPAARSQ